MSGLRAHWTVGAAGVVLAGAVFNFSGGSASAAQVIDIPESQQTAPVEEKPAVEASPLVPLLADELAAEPRVEVAQFPPPPFYSGLTYTSPPPFYQQGWRWPWESDTPVQPRSRREMRQQEIRPPN
jgi:hypothetical protein